MDFHTHNEANEQFDYEPHIAQQLDIEERRVSVRLLQPVKQSTSSLWGRKILLVDVERNERNVKGWE